jgi:predicted nucleic acid-binding protein
MAVYLLDSSVIIDVLNRKRNRAAQLAQLVREGNLLACCAINVAEVYACMRPGDAEETEEFLRSLAYYEVTWEVARTVGRLRYHQARRGRTQSLADMIIASIALENRLILITDNVKDFAIDGIAVYPMKEK